MDLKKSDEAVLNQLTTETVRIDKIANALDMTVFAVHHAVVRLEAEGKVERISRIRCRKVSMVENQADERGNFYFPIEGRGKQMILDEAEELYPHNQAIENVLGQYKCSQNVYARQDLLNELAILIDEAEKNIA